MRGYVRVRGGGGWEGDSYKTLQIITYPFQWDGMRGRECLFAQCFCSEVEERRGRGERDGARGRGRAKRREKSRRTRELSVS
eukprot:749980-Hanusia_phi.AAC.4